MHSILRNVLYLFASLALVFCLVSPATAGTDALCSGNNATVECLKNNCEQLYSENYDLFWDIIYKSEKKAYSSGTVSDVRDYLELASIKDFNSVEFDEYLSEAMPKLFIMWPEMFLDALSISNEETVNGFVYLLQTPLGDNETEITALMKKYGKDSKYKIIMDKYFANNSDNISE
ncbi:MAG: hypothetical protein HZC51_10325 [Nitrospirae bacterium]|nr:hypothetical protein [Nitrospirota bacterium]